MTKYKAEEHKNDVTTFLSYLFFIVYFSLLCINIILVLAHLQGENTRRLAAHPRAGSRMLWGCTKKQKNKNKFKKNDGEEGASTQIPPRPRLLPFESLSTQPRIIGELCVVTDKHRQDLQLETKTPWMCVCVCETEGGK